MWRLLLTGHTGVGLHLWISMLLRWSASVTLEKGFWYYLFLTAREGRVVAWVPTLADKRGKCLFIPLISRFRRQEDKDFPFLKQDKITIKCLISISINSKTLCQDHCKNNTNLIFALAYMGNFWSMFVNIQLNKTDYHQPQTLRSSR